MSEPDRVLALLFAGELEAAQRGTEHAAASNGDARPQPLSAALGLRLAYLGDDDAAAERYAESGTLEAGLRSNDKRAVGLIAGCLAAFQQARGRTAEAWELRRRALTQVDAGDFSYWLLDQMATSPDADDVARARAILDRAAHESAGSVAAAYLALFDSRRDLAAGRRDTARALARETAQRFEQAGRPWERAQSLEVAGELARALAIYEKFGYVRDAKRVIRARRRARHRPSTTHLTQREKEVAQLATAGLSNRAIAETLFIGERTVETHITAVFERFRLSSRKELGALLQRLQIPLEPPAPTQPQVSPAEAPAT